MSVAMKTCPICSNEIPEHAPAGICPKCLMQAGLVGQPTSAAGGPANFEPPDIADLQTRFPQLEVLELLGRGGMGAVYKARQRELDRLVAIKILPPEVGEDFDFTERFTREARALAMLAHPNIVSVHDFGEVDGLYYLTMEYVDGANLRHLMEAGGLKPEQALAIVPQICEALQFAHDKGIVHRDIKPENILLDRQGTVKIADFGLAKLVDDSPHEPRLTYSHQVMGTMHYMAPEQIRRTSAVDHRADIYSLGVVFYELLTGQLPLGRFDPPSMKTHGDARLDEVVMRSLAAEPQRRYQQASDVKTDLQSIAADVPPVVAAPAPIATGPGNPLPMPAAPGKLPLGDSVKPRMSRAAILGACWAPFLLLAIIPFFVTYSVVETRGTASVSQRSVDGRSSDDRSSDHYITDSHSADSHSADSHSADSHSTDSHSTDSHSDGSHLGHSPEAETSAASEFRPSTAVRVFQWFLLLVVLPLGLTAPVGTTILGMISINNIRHSAGRVYGLPLAVADAMLYPLLLLDALIVTVAFVFAMVVMFFVGRFFGNLAITYFILASSSLVVSLPICLIIDALLLRGVWRRCRA